MKTRQIHHLYLHVPFCAKVCPYCAFYVHLGGAERQGALVEAMCREIEHAVELHPLAPQTIYFGGGTPSLLSPPLFSRLIQALPAGATEITLEVNPATVTEAKALAWKEGGVNRISLGAQSFDLDFLKILGRDHSPQQIHETIALLRQYEFTNINLDLMFALPQQPREVWTRTLQQALATQPDHVSCYALTYEEDTPFFEALNSGKWRREEEDEIAMFTETVEVLTAAGLPPYEISNFARPGKESSHNRAYWEGKDYLGFGPSATSTVGSRRWKNLPDTAGYITRITEGKSVETENEELTPEIRRREQIMFGLRLREGILREWLIPWESRVTELVDQELMFIEGERIRLSSQGRLVADSIAGMFA